MKHDGLQEIEMLSREKDIREIAKSIHDLAEIFQEFTNIVHGQGEILDHIEYNMDHTEITVTAAVGELAKAQQLQKKPFALIFAIILILVFLFLLTLRILYHYYF